MKIRQLAIIGVMAVSFAAVADDTSSKKVFDTLDKNGDGKITKEEAAGVDTLVEDWVTIDVNNDGSIEVSEFAAVESIEAYTPVEDDNEPIGAAPTK
jgi:Ca2+-binding EF-hand superfamily protein